MRPKAAIAWCQVALRQRRMAGSVAGCPDRPYLPPGEKTDDEFPLLLMTGRRLQHYNAGTMTRRTGNLALQADERLEMHPADAARLDIGDGQRVEVASRRGAVAAAVDVTDRVTEGQLFLAFHFPEVLANALTSDATDEVTSCPEYKVTAVRVSPTGA